VSERIRITDPDPRVEAILEKMDAQQNQTIVGLDGKPLFEPLVDDRTVTYSKDGVSHTADFFGVLKAAARMHRDGMSLEAIMAELDLVNVSKAQMNRALLIGIAVLEQDIAAGTEPEESVRVLGYTVVDDEPDDTNEATVEDLAELARRLDD